MVNLFYAQNHYLYITPNRHIEMEQFYRSVKNKSESYLWKKAKILSAEHFKIFLNDTPDKIFLQTTAF